MILRQLVFAFRNVCRNKRRTAMTLAAMITGGVAIIVVGGYIEYSFWGLREMAIRSELGHIQVYQSGFIANGAVDPSGYLLTSDRVDAITRVLDQQAQVTTYAKRLGVVGLISNGSANVFFLGEGVEPDREAAISSTITIVSGTDLFAEDRYTVSVGKGLAEHLRVKPGDTVTLLVTTHYGGLNAMDFTVSGIISNGIKAFDDKVIRMNLVDAQELMGMTQIERLIVLLADTDQTPVVYTNLQMALNDVDLRPWYDMADYYHQVKTVYATIFTFLKSVIVVVIVLSIMNTMMMAVMERVTEIGILRAMGTSRAHIAVMFLNEGLILGAIGGVLAVSMGLLCAYGVTVAGGVYMPPPPGHTTGYMILITPTMDVVMWTMGLVMGCSVISSIVPAIKASRWDVMEAIRHV
jgi:putative ABC transport system permease protein